VRRQLDRSAEESETRRKVDDDAEVARGLMASCAFEFWAYVIANSRVLDVVRAHSLQLDDELARSQKVAKALRERYYLIAIGMVQQIRNRDQQIPRDPWSRDEKNCPWSGYGIAQHALLRFWREAGELKPNYALVRARIKSESEIKTLRHKVKRPTLRVPNN